MTIQLRQICLVARELEPVLEDLTDILGINRCYVDPGVGVFGLENTLMPIGRNFLEVVAPVEENTLVVVISIVATAMAGTWSSRKRILLRPKVKSDRMH
jgi:hypothetical protein